MSAAATPQHVLTVRARLGEGPVWDPMARCLYWLDIYNHRVHGFDPVTETDQVWDVGDVVGSLALADNSRLLLAQRHHLSWLDLTTGQVDLVIEVEPHLSENRCNDGKCDPQGRFWFGTMGPAREGSLYRYSPDGSLQQMETGLTISNGLGWSPDGQWFYLTDSPCQVIYRYGFDPETGSLFGRQVWIDLTGESYFPDGLTVDSQGCLWVALWDGWAVARFDPDGQEIERIPMPVQRPTCCTFGGENLNRLYITTASVGLSEKEIEKSFFSGDLYCLETNVTGIPAYRFGYNPT